MSSARGYEFLAIYLGPVLFYLLFFPLVRRVVHLAKAERITSVADFMAARYGKNPVVAALVTLIAVFGMIPYIALQLKAVSLSVSTLVQTPLDFDISFPYAANGTFIIALLMAAFALLFGTRHIDATEHQEGLMRAIALEAIVKIVAFLAVGIWVSYFLFDNPAQLISAAYDSALARQALDAPTNWGRWIAISLLSFVAILLLPRQFHVTVTENNSESELRLARWLFPAYIVAINIFVVPIALAGLVLVGNNINPDMFVLALPMESNLPWLTLIVFLGGLSAATAMVIVTTVALAIMVSNDIVMPLILRRGNEDEIISSSGKDMSRTLLFVRRLAIFCVILAGYSYYNYAGDSAALASFGLLSFAAIAQFAPAFFGGLFWKGANARGAIAGMIAGFCVWTYALFLPEFINHNASSPSLFGEDPMGLTAYLTNPLGIEGADPFVVGVLASLLINLIVYILASLSRPATVTERVQANIFVPDSVSHSPNSGLWRTSVTIGELQATIARYVGEERTQRSFDRFSRESNRKIEASMAVDSVTLSFSEQLLASAIGSASSRLVITLLLKRRSTNTKEAIKLLDDASEAIQYNRDLLQIALDQVKQGIAVFDSNLELTCWNRRFRELLSLPPEFGQVGTSLKKVIDLCAERGEFGDGDVEQITKEKVQRYSQHFEAFQEHFLQSDSVLEVRSNAMPDGGVVTTYSDITERVLAEAALARANETLERRVRERTEQLTKVNNELNEARQTAENAFQDKTRFLAAAGHDILQPLNAARLYSSSLSDRFINGSETDRSLAHNIETSLESVEEIISAVLDISRFDTGSFKPQYTVFRLDEIFNPLRKEFAAIAADKGLKFKILPTKISVRSDRRLLRRLLQNLISNALKYTREGGVVVGCRKYGSSMVRIEVYDSGIGIAPNQQENIFKEFQRLDDGARVATGLGLGLSIVDRISKVLSLNISLKSQQHKGSCFSFDLKCASSVPQESREEATTQITGQLQGLRVLAIDNEQQILDGMAALLTGWGCSVLKAKSAVEAAKAIHLHRAEPHIILADYHLDTGTGPDAVMNLRWKFGQEFPAVLITADRTQEVRQEAKDKHMSVLHKPVKPAALRAHLSKVKNSLELIQS